MSKATIELITLFVAIGLAPLGPILAASYAGLAWESVGAGGGVGRQLVRVAGREAARLAWSGRRGRRFIDANRRR